MEVIGSSDVPKLEPDDAPSNFFLRLSFYLYMVEYLHILKGNLDFEMDWVMALEGQREVTL